MKEPALRKVAPDALQLRFRFREGGFLVVTQDGFDWERSFTSLYQATQFAESFNGISGVRISIYDVTGKETADFTV